jgi:hypothetical protein
VPYNQILYIDRLSDPDGVEMTFDNLVKIIRAFIISKKVIEDAELPAQLMTALRDFMNLKENVTTGDVDYLTSVLKFYNYQLKVIGRLDLIGKEVELSTDDQMAYLIDNFRDNSTETDCFYTGYGNSYGSSSIPKVMDFIGTFNLSQKQIESYDELSISKKTYDLFKSEGRLNDFNDSIPYEFIRSRGMEFIIERFL